MRIRDRGIDGDEAEGGWEGWDVDSGDLNTDDNQGNRLCEDVFSADALSRRNTSDDEPNQVSY